MAHAEIYEYAELAIAGAVGAVMAKTGKGARPFLRDACSARRVRASSAARTSETA